MRRARAMWSRIMKVPSERARVLGIEERIDHREAVAEHVGQRDREQVAGAAAVDAAVGPAPAVFDHAGLDVAVLDHHGVVEHGHVGHAAVAMAEVEIGAEHRILLGGRHRDAHLADQVALRSAMRRMLRVGRKSSATTRTETQARQVSQAGR